MDLEEQRRAEDLQLAASLTRVACDFPRSTCWRWVWNRATVGAERLGGGRSVGFARDVGEREGVHKGLYQVI